MKSSKKSSQLSHNLQYQKNDEKLNYTNDCKLSKLINWITSQTWSKMLRVSIKIPCKRRSSLRKMIELFDYLSLSLSLSLSRSLSRKSYHIYWCTRNYDVGDARRFLFSIIYVCKSIVFLCFRSQQFTSYQYFNIWKQDYFL